jgi:hypothetical protein
MIVIFPQNFPATIYNTTGSILCGIPGTSSISLGPNNFSATYDFFNSYAESACSYLLNATFTATDFTGTSLTGTDAVAMMTNMRSSITNSTAGYAAITDKSTMINPSSVGVLSYSDTGIVESFSMGSTGYIQVVVSNPYATYVSSADVVVSNDLGTASDYYGDFGINSSGFTGFGSISLPHATYMYSQGGDMVIGTMSNNTLRFFTNAGTTDEMTISPTGIINFPGATGSSTSLNFGSDASANLYRSDVSTIKSDGNLTLAGDLNCTDVFGTTGIFTGGVKVNGMIVGTTGVFTGGLSGTTGWFTGGLYSATSISSASTISGTTGGFSAGLLGTTGWFTGSLVTTGTLRGATGSFTAGILGTTGWFNGGLYSEYLAQAVNLAQTVQTISVSASVALNCASGNNVIIGASGIPGVLTAATTITFTNPKIGSTTYIYFQQGTTSYAVTFMCMSYNFYLNGSTALVATGSVVLSAANMTSSQFYTCAVTWLSSTTAMVHLQKNLIFLSFIIIKYNYK